MRKNAAARRRAERTAEAKAGEARTARPVAPPRGGRYRPLTKGQARRITDAAFEILERIGLADAPEPYLSRLRAKGAGQRADGRLTFSRALVADAIGRAATRVEIPGFVADHGIAAGGGRVHIGTGGAAVETLDAASGAFRPSTLADLYRMMRVLDACGHIHYAVRPLVARDMPSPFELDINTAFACMTATTKPIGVSFDRRAHVTPVIELFDTALGGEGAFCRQPFCMAILTHVVPPLRYAGEACAVIDAAVAAGMPLQICSAGQAGATSPAALSGALAQGLAESLAGLMLVDALAPGHACIYAFMPFISDLRTGAMSGGGGEAAVANAAAAQLLLELGLPSTVSAGMTDAKIADEQAGYEKGYTVALAAQAGADMINLSVGLLGSIMVASPEALVIDDEMCGAILRAVRGVEVRDDLLDLDMIERVVTGEGHYLGQSQTLELMRTEYLYPSLADRQSVGDWLEAGGTSIWQRARRRVEEILAGDPPDHVPAAAEARIRAAFPIRLSR